MFKPNYPFYDPDQFTMLSIPERVGAPPAYTGRGVVIAFIDSGFYPHPDFADRVLVHADATSNRIVEGRRYHEPAGYAWHGQMTAAIACGDGRTGGGKFRGIASNANLVLIKVSNYKKRIKEPDILRGMEWLLANHRRFNVRILNISVGGDFESNDPDHPLYRACRALHDAGVIVLVAAGNRGARQLVPPASAPTAITVGGYNDQNSLDQKLWVPYTNNYGTAYDGTVKPEVISAAVWIPSPIMPDTEVAREAYWLSQLLRTRDPIDIHRLIWEGRTDLGILPSFAKQPVQPVYDIVQERINKHKIIDGFYQHVDGTSVSTPIVSSIVAQLLEVNPTLTPEQVRAMLTATAQPLTKSPAEKQGAGCVDPAKAVAKVLEATHAARHS